MQASSTAKLLSRRCEKVKEENKSEKWQKHFLKKFLILHEKERNNFELIKENINYFPTTTTKNYK